MLVSDLLENEIQHQNWMGKGMFMITQHYQVPFLYSSIHINNNKMCTMHTNIKLHAWKIIKVQLYIYICSYTKCRNSNVKLLSCVI